MRMFVAMLFGTASGILGHCLCYINGPIFDNRNPSVREECFPHLLDSEGCSSCGGNHGCMR